jgi:selenide,water dikinase
VTDDPFRYGRVAAANALSDVQICRALFALNPAASRPDPGRDADGSSRAAPGAGRGGRGLGGHVRDQETKYGMAVVGAAEPGDLLTVAGARSGQRLVLPPLTPAC